MKATYQKARHLRAHTWKDIGGFGGLVLDAAFFVFVLMVSGAFIVLGAITVVLDYLVTPFLRLGGWMVKPRKQTVVEPTLTGTEMFEASVAARKAGNVH